MLIARGAHLDAIRRDGITVEAPSGRTSLRIEAAAHPAEVDWRAGDVALLAMKSMDTEAALRELAAVAPPDTPVVCVQNGVANERAALRMFANVYGICVMFPAAHLEPGVVQAQSEPITGLLDIGRYPEGLDDTAEAIAANLRDATFESVPRPDIMRWKYTKLLMNLGNSIDALCGRDQDRSGVLAKIRQEGEAALEAAGITFTAWETDRERRGDLLNVQPINGQPRSGGSSWQSLARGTGSIEADYLNGEIVLLGRLHGVETPVNDLARRLANQAAREGTPPGSFTPDRILELVH